MRKEGGKESVPSGGVRRGFREASRVRNDEADVRKGSRRFVGTVAEDWTPADWPRLIQGKGSSSSYIGDKVVLETARDVEVGHGHGGKGRGSVLRQWRDPGKEHILMEKVAPSLVVETSLYSSAAAARNDGTRSHNESSRTRKVPTVQPAGAAKHRQLPVSGWQNTYLSKNSEKKKSNRCGR